MIISKHPQGTPEWLTERAGIPTSSSFDMLITSVGKPSKQRQKYLYSLAAERLTGVKIEHYQSQSMQNGIALEDEARSTYEFITGNEVKQVGVCFPDKRKLYGSSPDGLVGKNIVLEVKCPEPHTHIGYLLDNKLPIKYFAQVQGQLLVTDRKYAHFFSYYPGLKPLLIEVEQDNKFLDALAIELEIFCKELDEITEKLQGA
jgi:predicted phage-related endonuclease